MRIVRITSLQWATGGFLCLLGALMLVAPHQFGLPDYTAFQSDKVAWGFFLLLLGTAIFITTIVRMAREAVLTIHLIGGAVFLLLARGFAGTDFWVWAVNYSVLGFFTIVVGVIHYFTIGKKVIQSPHSRVDIFAIFMAANQALTGLLFILSPGAFNQPRYDTIRPFFLWLGIIFLISAFAILYSQIRIRNQASQRIIYPLAALVFLAYLSLVSIPNHIWQGIVYYGLYGIMLGLLPWINNRINRFNPALLRTRVALILAVTMAVPLILTMTLISSQEEDSYRQHVLDEVEHIARLISKDVESSIQLHRSALYQLSISQPLLQQDPVELKDRLQDFAADFPNIAGVAVFDAAGKPVARNDNAPAIPITDYPVFERARLTGKPSIDTLVSPVYKRPVISLGAPIDRGSGFDGIVVAALDSTYFAHSVLNLTGDRGIQGYLVDDYGRTIAHPDETVAPLADFSNTPPVRAYLDSLQAAGQLEYQAGDGDHLAGYSRVPGLGWLVVVEEPAGSALQLVHKSRDLGFGILLFFLATTTFIGALMADWMTRPLQSLQEAAQALASGNAAVPLPTSQIREIQTLADVFGDMRDHLALRTAEREHADEALRRANEELEARVTERTADLQRVNQQLTFELGERSKAEEFLRRRTAEAEEGRRILQALMSYIPAGIAIAECPSGEVRMVSRFGQEMLGQDHSSKNGSAIVWEFYWPDGATLVRQEDLPLARAIRNGEMIQNEEWIIRQANGEKVTILCNAGPVLDPTGKITGGVMSWVDISETKRTSEAIASYARALARSNKDLQDFAYIASHDLQEPLRKIQAFSQKVVSNYHDQLDETGSDYLQRMQNAAHRMQTMIDDLLAYSRVTTKSQPMQPISLNEVMNEVITDLELRIEQSEGRVDVEDLPTVYADRTQMGQLLQNLVANGLKFHRPDVSPLVKVYSQSGSTDGSTIELIVEDNGIGFNEQYLERIFQPFQRLHGRGEYEGSGIGLAICRKIVERHNGSITARSTPGQGARFIITLPQRQPENQGDLV